MPPAPRQQAQFSVGFIRDLFAYCTALGHSSAALCQAAGVSPELLAQPEALISNDVAAAAWRSARQATSDPYLGLHLATAVHPSSLGLLGYAMLSSATFGQALERLIRFWRLKGDGSALTLERSGPEARLKIQPLALPANYLFEERHPLECSLAAARTLCQHLTGQALPALRVAIAYPPPPDVREYQRAFGCTPQFQAPENEIVFPLAALAWPILLADSTLLANFESELERRLRATQGSLLDQVREQLALQLRGEVPTLESIARQLKRSERSLQRELNQAGTSFLALRDELRRDLALEHLRNLSHTIGDIAFLLGFAEASVFHRSFRKWTGTTPQAYRASLGL